MTDAKKAWKAVDEFAHHVDVWSVESKEFYDIIRAYIVAAEDEIARLREGLEKIRELPTGDTIYDHAIWSRNIVARYLDGGTNDG